MNIDYLREFVILSKNCHFLETANDLYISQSSLSKHMKALETELGQELFDRSTRIVELSAFGKEFLPYARQIVDIQQEYTEKLLAPIKPEVTGVTLAGNALVTSFSIKDFIKLYIKNHPGSPINFENHRNATLLDMLKNDEADAVIVLDSPEIQALDYEKTLYTQDEIVAIVPALHPYAKKEYLTLKEVAKYPIIQLGHENLTRCFNPPLPDASIITSQGKNMISSVIEDLGIAVCTRYGAKFYLTPGAVIVPIRPQTQIQMYVLSKSPKRKNKAFLEELFSYLKTKKSGH